MSDDGGVTIGLKEVYDEVQKMSALLTPLVHPEVGVITVQRDHEHRIRRLEAKAYALPGAATLVGIAGIALAVFRG